MMESGYVYLLINASMPGLVKIGRTQNEPDSRAKELSGATGIPTPFLLAFDAYVADAIGAEQYVHTLLEGKGYRISSNREFFQVPIKEAIEAIQAAAGVFSSSVVPTEAVPGIDASSSEEAPWRALLDLADAAHSGDDGTLQDDHEALRLYDRAAKLGSTEACLRAGQICRNDECRDEEKAIAYFKEGARRGDGESYKELAAIYAERRHTANWEVCWQKYFASAAFATLGNEYEGTDRPEHMEVLRSVMRTIRSRNMFMTILAYTQQARRLRMPPVQVRAVMRFKDELLAVSDGFNTANEDNRDSWVIRRDLEYFRQLLGEGEGIARVRGRISFYSREKESGFIRLDNRAEAFFWLQDCDFEWVKQAPVLDGMAVTCQVIERSDERPIAFNIRPSN